ncbi:MAG TPA: restriction endonuclease [Candidatus Krumholzibacteriaceae bacterium]|nr:restriction endonuclease [Candidatus Krumholzibacteriaceae bacterium]
MTKNKTFWPIPGGLDNYLNTVYETLDYINQAKPSHAQLVDWFLDNFDRVKSRQNAQGYVNNVFKSSGLISFKNRNELSLTQDGLVYLQNRDANLLFEVINNNVVGFSEILTAIKMGKHRLDEIHKQTQTFLEGYVNWTSTHPVKYRLDWLRAFGLVSLSKGSYTLTDEVKVDIEPVEETKIIIKSPEEKDTTEIPKTPSLELSNIINSLRKTEHDSKNPSKFEEAIAKAFQYLGFFTEHLGNSGDTDVLVIAKAGKERYSMIVDGKTSKHEKISERQISWPTIKDHKNLHFADFALIVAPDFSGGDMIKRASEFEVSLMRTDELIELLKMHEETPLNLIDLKSIFSSYGIINIKNNEDFMHRVNDYLNQKNLLPKLISQLRKLQSSNEKTSIRDLYWSLNKEFTEYEINQTLNLLQSLSFIHKDEKDNYYSLVEDRTIKLKFESLFKLFN